LNETLGVTDGCIFVTATTTNVVLPASSGFSGKEVLITNQKASGSLTVVPGTGEQILAGSPVSVAVGQAARFISDGAGTWVKQ
jgi:hypothetical protein